VGVRVGVAGAGLLDFFISYTGVDVAWARWVAAELDRAGYRTFLQVLDIRPGQDFVHEMQEAMARAGRTIAVWSPAYEGSRFAEAEWRAAFAADPSGGDRRLIPVRVAAGMPAGLLGSRVGIDLVGCDEATARDRLLDGVGTAGDRPTSAAFPGPGPGQHVRDGLVGVSFPGREPTVSNLPARNRLFVGRTVTLEQLHERLHRATVAAVLPVEAVHGLGGIGKTELVVEFAHRYRSDYDIVWWIPAEEPITAAGALVALAARLGIPAAADQQAVTEVLFEQLRQQQRWLLIYDNAEQPHALGELLPPAGAGHVIVTSRWPAWRQHADSLLVQTLPRTESVRLLAERAGVSDPTTEQQDQLARLAELVGDLPLALSEAGAYLEQTRLGLAQYLQLLQQRAGESFGLTPTALADRSGPEADQRRVATVWSVSLQHLHRDSHAAEALLQLLAFLGTDVPRALLVGHPEVLLEPLGDVVADLLAYNQVLAAAARYSLIDLDPESITTHRLVQAVIRARLTPDQEAAVARSAVGLLAAAFPEDCWEVTTWTTCERLLPHLLAVCEHAQRLRVAGGEAAWLLERASNYLRERGLYRQALPLAQRALALTEAALAPDDVELGWRHDELGHVLRALGDLTGARTHLERALQISEAALDPNHRAIGGMRNSLGLVLRDLGDLTGARCRRSSNSPGL
jgi:tetratricopeptide (TPR) repeat protein